jgi:O-antigen ligase
MVRIAGYGMYSGANDFALILTIVFALVFVLFEISKNILIKIILLMIMVFYYYLVILTVSRGGFLGISIVAALSIYFARRIPLISKYKFLKIAIIFTVFIGVLGLMAVKLSQRRDASSMLGGDESASHRLDAWVAGAKMLVTHPLYGIGYRHFPEKSREYGTPLTIQAHNTIVKVAAEAGFFGVFFYLGLLYIAFKKLKIMRNYYLSEYDDEKVILIQGVLFALIGFFFNTQFSVKEIEWLLYILLGLSVAMYRIYEDELIFKNMEAIT